MLDIGSSELLLIVIVALVVIGPKDLPRALYKVGQIVGKARGMARHFRTGIDAMVREVELEELEKKWATQNQRIMAEHPADDEPLGPLDPPAFANKPIEELLAPDAPPSESGSDEPQAKPSAPVESASTQSAQSAFPGFPEPGPRSLDDAAPSAPAQPKDGASA